MNGLNIRYFLSLVLLLLSHLGFSQSSIVGLPLMRHFYKSNYNAGTQNWSISQDSKGLLYFANNNGVLRYDGTNWKSFPIPDNKLVRSVLCVNDTIFVGSFEEFGFLVPDTKNDLRYMSLSTQLGRTIKGLDEIWRIFRIGDSTLFQSFTHIVVYKAGRVITYQTPESLQFSFTIGSKYYVQGKNGNIYEFINGTFIRFDDGGVFRGKQIWASLSINDKTILATLNNGVWVYDNVRLSPWKGLTSDFLTKNQIFSAAKVQDNLVAFGTIQDGLIITDEFGNLIQHINKSKGLQNNTVLSTFLDKDKNLWLGLDNGIDYLELNSSISNLGEGLGLLGAVYTSTVYNSNLYVGTNQGVYKTQWPIEPSLNSSSIFSRVDNTKGQVWSLEVLDGKLYCGHNFGTLLIDGSARVISEEEGSWIFLKLRNQHSKMIVGKYNGMHLYQLNNGTWNYFKKVRGFNESSRKIVEDENENIWMAHGYKGIFKIKLNESKDSVVHSYLYDTSKGFPNKNGINVEKIRNQIIFITNQGIYRYNALTDRMEPYGELNRIIGDTLSIRSMVEDKSGNIWIHKNNGVKVLVRNSEGNSELLSTPLARFSNSFVNSYENIYIHNESNVFIGTENGLVRFDFSKSKNDTVDFRCFIKEITTLTPTESIRYLNYISKNKHSLKLKHKENSVRITYSSPLYSDNNVTYSYILDGYDSKWSEWTSDNYKEYTNLSSGNYSFRVKAKNIKNEISDEASYSISIGYPWYLKPLAWLVYLILFAGLVWLVRRIVKIKIAKATLKIKEQQRLELKIKEEEYKREVLEAEREIIRLRNENLQVEVDRRKIDLEHKNREIASIALHITHKNEILNKLKIKLENVSKNNPSSQKELEDLIKTINSDLKMDNDWQRFELHFDEVHGDFIKRLKERYSKLSPSELRLCAYLRLNMSTKDIAQILNISVRGVEISRYRLRKKLEIESDTNLIDFMMNL